MCRHDWCGKCRVPWHEGLTCDEHVRHCGEQAADQGFAQYKKENKARRRPQPFSHGGGSPRSGSGRTHGRLCRSLLLGRQHRI